MFLFKAPGPNVWPLCAYKSGDTSEHFHYILPIDVTEKKDISDGFVSKQANT